MNLLGPAHIGTGVTDEHLCHECLPGGERAPQSERTSGYGSGMSSGVLNCAGGCFCQTSFDAESVPPFGQRVDGWVIHFPAVVCTPARPAQLRAYDRAPARE